MGWRSHIGTHFKEGLRPVIDLVYPPRCPLCGDSIASQEGLCSDCWSGIEVPGEPCCTTCQRPIASTVSARGGQCAFCSLEPPLHHGIAAASAYNDASRKLILTLKHGGKIALAPLLAKLMATRIPTEWAEDAMLVPVPLHRRRLWQRGFNQAALLARELHKLGKGEILIDALERHKRTPSLGGLGREEREQALSGAITVRAGADVNIAGRNVLLVDDVLTSGATSNACVTALLNAGAASVRIVCFARVLDGASIRQGDHLENRNARGH